MAHACIKPDATYLNEDAAHDVNRLFASIQRSFCNEPAPKLTHEPSELFPTFPGRKPCSGLIDK